jgi:general secretion pathway protein I
VTARGARGFTLLEAIVALVIFSMGSMALYGWLATNLRTLERVEASRSEAMLARAALDVVRHVNPMADPTGGREAGAIRVEWRARPVEPVRRSVTQVGIPGPFEVGLYELEVRVLERGVPRHDFRVRQVGYRYIGGSAQDNDE